METSSITNMLTIFLIVSVIILFILVIAFIVLMLKRRTENQKEEDSNQIKIEDTKKSSSIIETKLYTTNNIKNYMEFNDIKNNIKIQKKIKRISCIMSPKNLN